MRPCHALALLALFAVGTQAIAATSEEVSEAEALAAALPGAPRTTCTKKGIPGDPINVALVGTCAELCCSFRAAGWYPADPVTLRSSVGIAASVALHIPYPTAPLSPLYLWGRQQDLAFELPVGNSAKTRHHARFWCSGTAADGRPLWLGADTFNLRVGISKTTGKFTHHIDPNIDRERDKLMGDLRRSGQLEQSFLVPHLGPTVGRNGEGDCYYTDGDMAVGILRRRCAPPAP